jgi:lactoylglutathione lyase
MAMRYVHTCLRVLDSDASERFYGVLGFESRGRLEFDTAYNIYLGLPGDGDVLELTVNRGRTEPYEIGTGYNHMAIAVDDLKRTLEELMLIGFEPEKEPYHPGDRHDLPLIAFVTDPDGYRIELIDGGEFRTPQDAPRL